MRDAACAKPGRKYAITSIIHEQVGKICGGLRDGRRLFGGAVGWGAGKYKDGRIRSVVSEDLVQIDF